MTSPAARRMTPFAVVLVVALVLVSVLVALVWLGQRFLIYHPDPTAVPPAAELLPGASDVTLTTSDGLALAAWYLPPSGSCRAAVLVAPGNGGNRAGRVELARAIHDHGFGVLLLDYRGYGGNPGQPSETGLARDARAARTFLVGDAGVSPRDLLYLGESIGTGVVSRLAVEHPPAAMVLRSPMTSLADVGRATVGVPVDWILRDTFAVLENVERGQAPIAVVYGSADEIVPGSQSREVARAARDSGTPVVEVEVPGAEHNDAALAHGPAVTDALVAVAELAGVAPCR